MPPSIKSTIFFLLFFGICSAAAGADIFRNKFGIVIEGEIQAGDFEKFRNLTNRMDPTLATVGTVNLASPGGSVAEAMRIGLLVRKLRWTTVAPMKHSNPAVERGLAQRVGIKNIERNNVCASACFFIYVAGAERLGAASGGVGIHRPYLLPEHLRSAQAESVIDQSKRGEQIVRAYMEEMDVPAKYTEMMFQVPKDRIRWLTMEEVEDFPLLIPGLHDWIESKCGLDPDHPRMKPGRSATDGELKKWMDYSRRHFDCRSAALEAMRMDALVKYDLEEMQSPSPRSSLR